MGIKKLFLITSCFVLVNSQISLTYAQEISPSDIPTPTVAPIEYILVYPGILPGHPFYFLKDARDNLWSFLISNPLKKAEFNLLQSDKNIQAAFMLFQNKQSSDLVFATIVKAENNYAEAIEKAKQAKQQGIGIKDFVTESTLANKKHQEVLGDMIKTAKKEDKKSLTKELVKVKQLGKKAAALTHK